MGDSSDGLPSALSRMQDNECFHASYINVSNIVSVKLSGTRNYLLWKAQMRCLLESNNMCGIVDHDTCFGSTNSGGETMKQYDSLVKGWIFGSVTEGVLVDVFNLDTAKKVWDRLKSIYDPGEYTRCLPEDAKTKKEDTDGVSVSNISHEKREREDINGASTEPTEEGESSIEIIVGDYIDPTEAVTKKLLRKFIVKGDWSKAESILRDQEHLATEAISNDGSTMLHFAVGIGRNDFVKKLLSYINNEQVLKKRDSDGSTTLHIAAIVGNTPAADFLVKKNSNLLEIADNDGKKPLQKAYENKHLNTIAYLLKAGKDGGKPKTRTSLVGSVDQNDIIVVDLLVNAISAKQYNLASQLVKKLPKSSSESDDVLMAIAKTYPNGLDYWETLVYPSMDSVGLLVHKAVSFLIFLLTIFPNVISCGRKEDGFTMNGIVYAVSTMVGWALAFTTLLIFIICFWSLLLYSILWKGAKILVPPIRHIENKKKEWDEAKKLLKLVCDEIDKSACCGTHHPFYTRPILEAACQNAYKVVAEILKRSPGAIQSKDRKGYDIIQLAIIHRSEKIYNLIYDSGERKNLYRTYEDSSKNNILHLTGKLPPSSVLNQRRGAALQLQRELQWFEEVRTRVIPIYITKENDLKETPGMIFTREHEKLVKEAEQWMKTTAESFSITAVLITTIVFAAAITVPGGTNEHKGTPLFKKEVAFIIFAISDAISLFASSTALLVFLSILTARFAEKDFLVSLPTRLFIGLFSLLLSTTTMMVAFSATLFLVFCEQKPLMLAPICGLAFIPIAFFVGLQFPLMVDLFNSTHLRIFGKQRKCGLRRYNPDPGSHMSAFW